MIFLLVALAMAANIQTPQQTSLKGVIVDVRGASVPRASVRVLPAGSNLVAARAISDERGAFEIGTLKPGSYTLTAFAPGFRFRVFNDVLIREGDINDLGYLRLSIASCDGPGVICDTFSSEPPIAGLIRQGNVSMNLNCGVDLVLGAVSCPGNANAEVTVMKEEAGIYLKPLNHAALFTLDGPSGSCQDSAKNEAKVRVDGFGRGLELCLQRRGGPVTHFYLVNDVEPDSTEVRIWFTTTR